MMPSSKTHKNVLVKTWIVNRSPFIYIFRAVVIKNLVILPPVKE